MKKILTLALITIMACASFSINFSTNAVANEKTQSYPFSLKPLPYTDNALEPFIDAKTMSVHHDKHVQAYVDNLNKALETHLKYHNYDLTWIITNINKLPKDIRQVVQNNAGGVYNHDFFFAGMLKDTSLVANSPLSMAINESFGSLDGFKEEFKKAALSQFGSGWAWLIADKKGKLSIVTTSNQDTPLKHGKPILAIDVWEHAYYLKYQNKRADYIDNWFNLINWDVAESNFRLASVK